MELLTTEQAAERLHVTPARVRVLIREGRLPAEPFGRAYMIRAEDLRLVENRTVGRPPAKSGAKKNGAK